MKLLKSDVFLILAVTIFVMEILYEKPIEKPIEKSTRVCWIRKLLKSHHKDYLNVSSAAALTAPTGKRN